MTLKNYSNKNFLTMFKQSMKQVCVFPIIAFIIGLFPCISDLYCYKFETRDIPDVSAVFFNAAHEGAVFLIFAAILSAVISALILFSFQWSKKQCNVIYSLGMSRDQIYTSKMLGGIVPMAGAAVALTLVETFVNLLCNFTVDLRYWKMVFYLMPSFLVIYILAFVLCSVVFANTGNLIEGMIFTAIIAPFTMVFESFLQSCLLGYTLGASNNGITWLWKWSAPFLAGQESIILETDYYGDSPYFSDYFFIYTDHNELHFLDYSLIITTIIYIAVLFTLGFFAFRKHKNETAGTWGRSKGMTEIAGAVTGFYAFDFALMFNDKSNLNVGNNFFDFVVCCLVFAAVMIIFKLVFSSKRKAAVKQTLNRFPAYAAVMGVITLIFSLGCFGYASKVPELSDVKSVSVSSSLYKYSQNYFADSSYYGLKRMNNVIRNSILDTSVYYTDKTDIDEILKLHKAIITDGKIKGKAIDGCGCPIEITYKLKNGKEITRSYSQTTTDTVKKIMMLNDLTASKKELERILNNYENIVTTEDNLNEYFDDDVEIKDGEIFSKINGDNLGSISGDTFIDGNTGEEISLEDISLTVFDNTMINYHLLYSNCYLYPKDMTRGFNIGKADKELCSALRKDIAAQSTADYFFHKAEDEVGVISLGFSNPPVNDIDAGYYIDESGHKTYIDSYGNKIEMTNADAEKVGQYVDKCAWNIYSSDISAIVVTKSMTNTLKYLETHGMMKYFENSRKVSDIKAVKLATPIELYDPNHTSRNLPVFAAGYWSGEYIREWEQGYDERYGSHFDVFFGHYFEKINNQITDTNTIKKLLESSVLFGFCGNDYRIMEIEYEDGSIGTTVIPASAYKEIVK